MEISILLILIAYLIGSVPTSVWVGRLFYGIDVREHGSGNAGATNTIRVLGYKAGIPVMLFDVFKGWLAVQLATWIAIPDTGDEGITYLKIACAIAAVLGHIFPVYVGFRGGKGVGTLAGVGIALYPLALLIVLAIFILTLALTRYVSLSSILAAVSFPFIVYFITGERHLALLILAILVAIFIPMTHRKNIARLLKGEENRFQFHRKKVDKGS
ncbi:MAG: glycerol-3-phosphate 1-O-acyltransferase PlsY [Bacteroidota bacterium]